MAEQREITERLTHFRQFDPPRFTGWSMETWEAESWVAAMEKLFEDLFVPARYQLHLAAHFLERDADAWWRRVRLKGSPGTQLLSWSEFCGLLFGVFFLNSEKQKLEQDLRNLQQGDWTV